LQCTSNAYILPWETKTNIISYWKIINKIIKIRVFSIQFFAYQLIRHFKETWPNIRKCSQNTSKLSNTWNRHNYLNLPFNTLFNHIAIWSLFSKIRVSQEPREYTDNIHQCWYQDQVIKKKGCNNLYRKYPYQQKVARNTPVSIKWKNNTEKITRSVWAVLWSYLKEYGKIQYQKLVEAEWEQI